MSYNKWLHKVIRTLPLLQKKYSYNGKNIGRPKLIINRDAHITSIGTNDAEWVKGFKTSSLATNGKYFFNPSSLEYRGVWHDFKKCFNNSKVIIRTGLPQGLFSTSNYTNDDTMFSIDEWKKSYGLGFIIKNDEDIALINHIPFDPLNNRRDYRYGLDEYLSGQLFEIESILERTIFLNYRSAPYVFGNRNLRNFTTPAYFDRHYRYQTCPNNASFWISLIILDKLGLLNDEETSMDLILKVERLREEENLTETLSPYLKKLLSQALAILPNKYKTWRTLYNLDSPRHGLSFIDNYYKLNNIKDILSNLNSSTKMKDNLIDKINNETFTLPCHNSLSSYPFNFCDTEGTKNTINTPCTISDFTTGFYFENPPNIDIGILRKPSDLLISMDAMQQNRLKVKFNKSLYKKIINTTKLLNDLSTLTTVNTTTGDINIIPQIIPTTGEVSDIVLEVKNRLSEGNDKLINPLIWKALNYSGYDIPVQWFDTSTDLTDDSDNLIFNDYVYALSKVNNWAKTTMEKL